MPTKLIVCLLAACCVAGAGMYMYMDTSSGCGGCSKTVKSTSADCPECLAANASCEGDTSSCCSKTSVKHSCCSDDVVATKDPMAAGLGTAVVFGTK